MDAAKCAFHYCCSLFLWTEFPGAARGQIASKSLHFKITWLFFRTSIVFLLVCFWPHWARTSSMHWRWQPSVKQPCRRLLPLTLKSYSPNRKGWLATSALGVGYFYKRRSSSTIKPTIFSHSAAAWIVLIWSIDFFPYNISACDGLRKQKDKQLF